MGQGMHQLIIFTGLHIKIGRMLTIVCSSKIPSKNKTFPLEVHLFFSVLTNRVCTPHSVRRGDEGKMNYNFNHLHLKTLSHFSGTNIAQTIYRGIRGSEIQIQW